MKTNPPDHRGLYELFLRSLGQPGARAGLRLKSERELASALGVSRARVAWVIGKLAKQGVVTRRTGSGTFLRDTARGGGRGRVIGAETLFSDSPASASAPTAGLRLGVGWLSMTGLTHANRLTLDGMVARAQELGATLTFHTLGIPGAEGFEHAARVLATHAFDGMLLCVLPYMADRLAKACEPLDRKRPPVAYFYSTDAESSLQPAVTLHAAGAASRGVELLVAEGHRRIGLIGYASPQVERAYDDALRLAGLSFRAVNRPDPVLVDAPALPELHHVRAGRRYAEELLNRRNAPDAFYVADDLLMLGVAEALAGRGLVPGRDIGVISLANAGGPTPTGAAWSQLVMDPHRLGRLAVDLIVEVIRQPDQPLPSLRLDAAWRPGTSHLRGA